MAGGGISVPARRIVVAGAAILLAGAGAWHAVATAASSSNPALIQSIDPSNPRALPLLVDQRTAASAAPGVPDARTVPLLRRSLERAPLNPRAIRQIAAYEAASGRETASRALLDVGGRTGRRDPMLNIMLAREAGLANDGPALIRHLDAALSTFRGSDAQVFPLLARPLGDPEFRSAIKGYMDRPWSEPFMLYAAQNADPTAVLALALQAPHIQRAENYARFRTELVSNLVSKGAPGAALNYVARVTGDRGLLANGTIGPRTTDSRFAPVTWRLRNEGGVYVTAQGAGVIVSTDAAARGRAAERVFALAPGRYRVAATATAPGNAEPVIATWLVACLRGGGEQVIARREAPVAAGAFALPFVVPAGCDAVSLTLDVVNRSDQNPAEYELRDLRLIRDRG